MWKDREFWAYNKPYFGLAQIKSLETVLKDREIWKDSCLDYAEEKKSLEENCISKDKIKAKIEELKQELSVLNERGFALYEDTINEKIQIYEELLEEE